MSKKRPSEAAIDTVSLYDDPNELINAVISVLAVPETKTVVSENFANDKNQATEVQAYAKIAGNNWTYYVKALSISIGRNTDNEDTSIDIDLGPAKVVSRRHATINYNLSTRQWELQVSGRNGAKVDGARIPCGANSTSTPLYSGAVVDIGGSQMMFILPDAQPRISRSVLDSIASRLPKPKKQKLNTVKNESSNNLKGFQMFNNGDAERRINGVSNGSQSNQIDNDLSKEEARDIKPPFSYATMITQAILSNPEGVLSLSEIYEWISKHYAFYRYSKTGWQNSIRHNLSLNKAFEKVPRRANEPGKGMKWQISDSYKSEFLQKFQNGSLSKVRRGSSVSRQLQLHLATHNDLPVSQSIRRKIFSNGDSTELAHPSNQNATQRTSLPLNQVPYPSQSNGTTPVQAPAQPSRDALSFMAAAATANNPYVQYQVPVQYGQNMYIPTQLPPLQGVSQQQNGNSQGQQQQLQPQQQPLPVKFSIQNTSNQASQPYIQHVQQTIAYPHQSISSDQNSSKPQTQKLSTTLLQTSQAPPATASTNVTTSQPNINSEAIKPSTAGTQLSSPIKPESPMKTPPKYYQYEQERELLSPTKGFPISAVEAYTPERGAKKKDELQSSPALWNFVQFSTPLQGVGNDKDANKDWDSREKGSPKMGDLRNVDLAKGFKK